MTSSVKHGRNSIMTWAYMASSGTVSLVFFDDVITDRQSKIDAEVFRGYSLLRLSQILEN